MENHQQSSPILSNNTLYERMFRMKPYTRCLDCLTNQRIKCRRCMENIIDQVGKTSYYPKSALLSNNRSKINQHKDFVSRKVRGKTSVMKREDYDQCFSQKLVLMNKFDMWIEETKKKKLFGDRTTSKWPRKIRLHDRNLERYGMKQPKFEKWEKKLLDQLMSKAVKH